MKHMLTFFSVAALVSTAAAYGSTPTSNADVAPYYSIRSQGVDAARELSGWAQHVNLFGIDKGYGSFSLTTEYTQSFGSQNIARSLFGQDLLCITDCNGCKHSVMKVSGSRAPNRGANDLLADNFYLPTDYQGTLLFNPTIKNVVADLNFYFGLDAWGNGIFLRVDAPINWTSWNLNFHEQVCNHGINNYDAGYFNGYDAIPTLDAPNGIGVENDKLNHTFGAYASGKAPAGVVAAAPSTAQVTMNGLCYGKFDCGARSITRLADLQIILGWNFLNESENYHVGVGLLTRAPTGNRPNGRYLFEPISGNGGSWELGAHITSHATFWRCESEASSLGFYLDANITHLFNAKQTRTFDLKDKPLSRYMLASGFTSDVIDLAGSTDGGAHFNFPSFQFANAFSPVANIATKQVQVSIGVQGDLAAQLTYVHGAWNWDLGYNFWGRTCEKFTCDNDYILTLSCTACPTSCNKFGLKGDSYVYGFDTGFAPPAAIPLSATESKATIHNGTNFAPTGATDPALVAKGQINPTIDAPQIAYNPTDIVILSATPSSFDALGNDAPTKTSVNPILLSVCDFDRVGTRGISNKFYTHVSYNWMGCDRWVPYVGIGAFGEFGNSTSCDSCPSSCYANCDNITTCSGTNSFDANCMDTALSQWGVWIKSGLSFD